MKILPHVKQHQVVSTALAKLSMIGLMTGDLIIIGEFAARTSLRGTDNDIPPRTVLIINYH